MRPLYLYHQYVPCLQLQWYKFDNSLKCNYVLLHNQMILNTLIIEDMLMLSLFLLAIHFNMKNKIQKKQWPFRFLKQRVLTVLACTFCTLGENNKVLPSKVLLIHYWEESFTFFLCYDRFNYPLCYSTPSALRKLEDHLDKGCFHGYKLTESPQGILVVTDDNIHCRHLSKK